MREGDRRAQKYRGRHEAADEVVAGRRPRLRLEEVVVEDVDGDHDEARHGERRLEPRRADALEEAASLLAEVTGCGCCHGSSVQAPTFAELLPRGRLVEAGCGKPHSETRRGRRSPIS